MNQIYRALHMPPKRLIKKLSGQKKIYTIAVRRAPKGKAATRCPLWVKNLTPRCPTPPAPGMPTPCCMRMTTANAGCSAKHSIWRRTAVILPWRSLMKTTTCCRPAWY